MKSLTTKVANDNIYPTTTIIDLAPLTGLETRKGLEKAVVVEGVIVNVVSNQYGHIDNKVFFGAIEDKLRNVEHIKRSINRENRSFAVDYILTDKNAITKVGMGIDKLQPMLRFVNSYDGSNKIQGSFAIYRQVCTNGLMAHRTLINFSVKHRGAITDIVMPQLDTLVNEFLNNEFYNYVKRFEVLAEKRVSDLNNFVKVIADKSKLFKFESSEKNPMPSLNARTVIDTVQREANLLGVEPNSWLVYNAFNELLHTKLKKSFEQQANIDAKLFEMIEEMA
jgi:hypothetical protein